MITRTVKRITIVLALGSVAIYAGFSLWWSTKPVVMDVAARPQKALERFDTSNAIIPRDRILAGGPPPDGIPSIDKPKFVNVVAVDFLKKNDEVIIYTQADQTRIYPFRILVWHEIVNDQFGDQSIAVTYCPLCGTAMVFDRRLDGAVLEFGVSGLLYNSDVLLFDRQTESLWTQLGRKCVSGKHAGKKLGWLASKQMTWAAAKEKYPNAQTLSLETGYQKKYDGEAYASYKSSPRNSFPVNFNREELERKAWILGIEINGIAKAYPIKELVGTKRIDDTINHTKISVTYDADSRFGSVVNRETNEPVPSVRSYWFAWQAFYPETEIWGGDQHQNDSRGE